MVLVRYSNMPPDQERRPNKTLQGHKLVVLDTSGWRPSAAELAALQAKYRDLKIQVAKKADITDDEWKDTTALQASFNKTGLPDKEQVPKLVYVQLSSAGANMIVDHPLYTDTDVAFCTANGVHGPQITEWIIMTFLSFQHNCESAGFDDIWAVKKKLTIRWQSLSTKTCKRKINGPKAHFPCATQ